MQIKNQQNFVVKLSQNHNLEDFMNSNNISKSELYKINNKTEFFENDIILLPKPYKSVYVVKPLDTIESISKQLNVDTNLISCATNGRIFVGQKIFL